MTLTLTADVDADAAYIDTGQRAADRQVAQTIPIRTDDGHVHGALDLDADGTLLGIEILGIRRRLPALAE